MKPYTYLIRHKPTNRVYYGVRTANKHEPQEDLWHHYFTSSPKIQELIEETGQDSFDVEIRQVFESKEKAIAWETRVLRRCRVLEDERWINQNVAGYIVPTEETVGINDAFVAPAILVKPDVGLVEDCHW